MGWLSDQALVQFANCPSLLSSLFMTKRNQEKDHDYDYDYECVHDRVSFWLSPFYCYLLPTSCPTYYISHNVWRGWESYSCCSAVRSTVEFSLDLHFCLLYSIYLHTSLTVGGGIPMKYINAEHARL